MVPGIVFQRVSTPRDVALMENAEIPKHVVNLTREKVPEYFWSTLWVQTSHREAYMCATDGLSHEVHIAPDRERAFERVAARALLLSETEGVMVHPNP